MDLPLTVFSKAGLQSFKKGADHTWPNKNCTIVSPWAKKQESL